MLLRPAPAALAAALALALPPTRALAAPIGGGCAPPGETPPRLTLQPGGGGTPPGLRLEGGAGRAGARALLLFEDGGGRPLPRTTCLAGLRVRPAAAASLDGTGAHRWPLPTVAFGTAPPLRALVLGPAPGLGGSGLSNPIKLPPLPPRAPWGAPGGQLVITEFMKDPSFVSDTKGEWIELYNLGPGPVDVQGWVLSDLGTDSTVLGGGGVPIPIPPGGYLVLGRESDPAQNGGVVVDVVYSGFTLSNGADEILLSRPDGTLVDRVVYDDGVVWPDTAGRSISLDPPHTDATANDDGTNWCHSSTPISNQNPDTGTPRAQNDSCGG